MSIHTSIRAEAARTLGIRGNVTVVHALVRALKDPSVKRETAAALGEIASPVALKGLEELCKYHYVPPGYHDDGVQSTAMSAIEKIGDDAAVDVLIRLMKRPLLKVRAVRVLGRLHNPRAAAPLAEMLQDNDESMVGAVENALMNIGAPAISYVLPVLGHRNWHVCYKACHTLRRIGTPAIEPLKKVMSQNAPVASSWAASALLQILEKEGMLREDMRAQCDAEIQEEYRREDAERKLMAARGLKWCQRCLSYQKTVKVSLAPVVSGDCAVCNRKRY